VAAALKMPFTENGTGRYQQGWKKRTFLKKRLRFLKVFLGFVIFKFF